MVMAPPRAALVALLGSAIEMDVEALLTVMVRDLVAHIVRRCENSAHEFLSLWESLWERPLAVGRNEKKLLERID
jgi:hypothetical protein